MALFKLTGVILDGTGTQAVPTRQDLTFPQGEDVTFQLTVTGANGSVFNITGYTGTMTWRIAQNTSSAPVLQLPITLTAPTSGVGTFTLAAVTSKGLTVSMFAYDIFLVSGAGAKDEVVPPGLITLNYAPGA